MRGRITVTNGEHGRDRLPRRNHSQRADDSANLESDSDWIVDGHLLRVPALESVWLNFDDELRCVEEGSSDLHSYDVEHPFD